MASCFLQRAKQLFHSIPAFITDQEKDGALLWNRYYEDSQKIAISSLTVASVVQESARGSILAAEPINKPRIWSKYEFLNLVLKYATKKTGKNNFISNQSQLYAD
jgi:hypothetical protein